MQTPAERKVAERSMLIKNMMEDLGEGAHETAVPIPNVSTPSSGWPGRLGPTNTFLRRSMSKSSRKLSSGASITRTTLPLPKMTTPTVVKRRPISRNGTRSLCRLIRKCSLRSSL